MKTTKERGTRQVTGDTRGNREIITDVGLPFNVLVAAKDSIHDPTARRKPRIATPACSVLIANVYSMRSTYLSPLLGGLQGVSKTYTVMVVAWLSEIRITTDICTIGGLACLGAPS
ncbi:hypothetical protein SCLCIDRAFT_1215125 [Scleroderma citrinum Foug A]|uniref:Uncharacterized protein n=1 Tax=Scleroderma citrinum Foug A TaxID=1036808 RepID=A0A0C3E3B5_9AGAM|nr:hypothetical protein SCLCIDRAFT_1215125 [Scleroderma citrinum Foug A]